MTKSARREQEIFRRTILSVLTNEPMLIRDIEKLTGLKQVASRIAGMVKAGLVIPITTNHKNRHYNTMNGYIPADPDLQVKTENNLPTLCDIYGLNNLPIGGIKRTIKLTDERHNNVALRTFSSPRMISSMGKF